MYYISNFNSNYFIVTLLLSEFGFIKYSMLFSFVTSFMNDNLRHKYDYKNRQIAILNQICLRGHI